MDWGVRVNRERVDVCRLRRRTGAARQRYDREFESVFRRRSTVGEVYGIVVDVVDGRRFRRTNRIAFIACMGFTAQDKSARHARSRKPDGVTDNRSARRFWRLVSGPGEDLVARVLVPSML